MAFLRAGWLRRQPTLNQTAPARPGEERVRWARRGARRRADAHGDVCAAVLPTAVPALCAAGAACGLVPRDSARAHALIVSSSMVAGSLPAPPLSTEKKRNAFEGFRIEKALF